MSERTRRQIMAATAKRMRGVKVSFRMDPEKRESRVSGIVEYAKVGEIHEPSGLLGYEVKVRGKSGKRVTIDSNVHFMTIHWDYSRRIRRR